MDEPSQLPDKHDVAQGLLLRGSLFIHLDPRGDQTIVPAFLSRQPQLVLQVGLDLPIAIPDLRIDEAGVSATLSFSRSPFTCSVPWEAVFALVGEDGRGMVWPEDLPSEIAAEVDREAGRRAPARPMLSEVPPIEDGTPVSEKPTAEKRPRSGGRRELPPYLRVVK